MKMGMDPHNSEMFWKQKIKNFALSVILLFHMVQVRSNSFLFVHDFHESCRHILGVSPHRQSIYMFAYLAVEFTLCI